MAMLATMLASIALFGLVPSLQLLLGIATASISLLLYYLPARALLGPEEAATHASPAPIKQSVTAPLLPK